MTKEEFNLKYKDYVEIEDSFIGCEFENEKVINKADELFKIITHYKKDFKFSQLKFKFDEVRFYSNLDLLTNMIIENQLNSIK